MRLQIKQTRQFENCLIADMLNKIVILNFMLEYFPLTYAYNNTCLASLDFLGFDYKTIIIPEPPTTRILNLLTLKKPRPPQKLLFSATLSQDPEKLQKLSLFQPKLFTSIVQSESTEAKADDNQETFIGKYTTPNELVEKYIITSMESKPLALFEFIRKENLTKCLVFSHSIQSAHRLTILLQSLFKDAKKIREISSSLDPKDRNNLIGDFDQGNIDM